MPLAGRRPHAARLATGAHARLPPPTAPTRPPTEESLGPERILGAMVELTRAATRTYRVERLTNAIVRIAARLAGADQASLALYRGDDLETVAAIMPRRPVGTRFPVGYGVAGWVVATGRAAEIEDVRDDRRYVSLPYPEVRAFLGLPLVVEDEPLAILSLAAWRPAAFPAGSAERLTPFLEHAALLLRRIQTDAEAHARLTTLEQVVSGALAASAHDMKTPVTAISGFLDILLREQAGPLSELQRQALGIARDECGRLMDGIAALVEIGAAGDRPAESTSEVSAAMPASQAIARTGGHAAAHEIRLSLEVEPPEQRIAVQVDALVGVLSGLLLNAVRVAPRGSLVTVRVDGSGGCATYSVLDEGPGFPPEQRERVFQRYGQAPTSDASGDAGRVGLGLWLARQVVARFNGEVWVQERPEGGGCVNVRIPALPPRSARGSRASA